MTDIPKPGQVADGPLAEIEAAHGFVFGNPDSDTGQAAPLLAALVCNANIGPGQPCPHRGQFVQIHADTTLPVRCGGCGTVLHCDHEHETTVIAPTLDQPLHHTVTACTRCGTEKTRQTRDATPAELAALIPPGLRAALKAL